MTALQRHIQHALKKALKQSLEEDPVVFIRGPRQSGKTPLVKTLQTGPQLRQYRILDDLAKLSAAKSYPRAFISAIKSPVTIDEVQRVPELLLAIKHGVDEDRTPVRFLLTGSAEVRGGSAVTESLTGQMRVLDLWWLSQSDIERTEGD